MCVEMRTRTRACTCRKHYRSRGRAFSVAAHADTMKFMMPLNKQLLLKNAATQPREWKRAKLALWGTLHHGRTAASAAALGLIVYKVFAKSRE
jgi:hypothetical protein